MGFWNPNRLKCQLSFMWMVCLLMNYLVCTKLPIIICKAETIIPTYTYTLPFFTRKELALYKKLNTNITPKAQSNNFVSIFYFIKLFWQIEQ